MKPTANGEAKEEIVDVKVGHQKLEEPVVSFITSYRDSTAVEIPQMVTSLQDEQDESSKWRGHYICSILSTVCCFGPLSVIGLVHFIAAKSEHRKGNIREAMKKKRQAKVWTAAAVTIGFIALLVFGTLLAIGVLKHVREHEEEEEESRAMRQTLEELKASNFESLKNKPTRAAQLYNDWLTSSYRSQESTTIPSTSGEPSTSSDILSTTPSYNSRYGSTTSVPSFIYFLYHIPATDKFSDYYYPPLPTDAQIPEDVDYWNFVDGTTFLPRTAQFPDNWETFETTPSFVSSSSSSSSPSSSPITTAPTERNNIDDFVDFTTLEPLTTNGEFEPFTSTKTPREFEPVTSTTTEMEFEPFSSTTTDREFEPFTSTDSEFEFSTSTGLPVTTGSEFEEFPFTVPIEGSATKDEMEVVDEEQIIREALIEEEKEEAVALQEAQITQLEITTENIVEPINKENMQDITEFSTFKEVGNGTTISRTSSSSTSSSTSSTTTAPSLPESTSTSNLVADLHEAIHPVEVVDNMKPLTTARVAEMEPTTDPESALDVVKKVVPPA